MLKRLQLDALQSDLKSVSKLLAARTEKTDPIGFRQFSKRKSQIEDELSRMKAAPRAGASVALFFGGRPVIGSKGIMADFGAKALEKFQDTVSTRFAAHEGPLGTRGPVKGRDRTQLMLTEVARGSFGFVLEEAAAVEDQDDYSVASALEEVIDLIYRSADPDLKVFDEAADYLDDRVVASMGIFLRHVDDSGATLRVVDDEREFALTRDAIERARERIENAKVSDTKRDTRGRLYFLPGSRKFELYQASGDALKGSIMPECWRELVSEAGVVADGVLGQIRTVTLSVKEVNLRGQAPRYSYKLLALQPEGQMPTM